MPAVGSGRLASYRRASCLDLAAVGSKEDHAQDPNQECPRGSYPKTKEELMKVIIGIDPHKSSHTAVAIGCDERQLAEIRVRATCQQTAKLRHGRNRSAIAPGPSSPPVVSAICCPSSCSR